MIDAFTIMTYGGIVLWSWSHNPNGRHQQAQLVDSLVSNILIEDKTNAQREHLLGDSKLKWLFSVEAQLVFIVIFPRFLQFMQIDNFLRDVREQFEARVSKLCPRARGNARNASSMYAAVDDYAAVFDDDFKKLLARFDALEKYASAPVRAQQQLSSNKNNNNNDDDDDENEDVEDENQDDENQNKNNNNDKSTSSSSSSFPPPPPANSDTLPPNASKQMKKQLVGRNGQVLNNNNSSSSSTPSSPTTAPTKDGKKPKKEARTWLKDGSAGTVSALQAQNNAALELERQSSASSVEQLDQAAVVARQRYVKVDAKTGKEMAINEKDWSEQVQERGRFASWFRSVVGNVELDAQDLAKMIPKLKEKLVSKNVAVDVADKICESLHANLTGKKIGTFASMEAVVEEALVDSLRRILRPKREINLLRTVEEAQARGRPATVCMTGVNGVGKTTSMAKIAYYLKQNGFSVLFAAGDTFRNGAVEQLQVHGRCLGIHVFQMGYNTDPTLVARNAIQYAKTNKIDVVLIDTAGRMQDHESRMAALARLIGENTPDLVLFVGEALVGNNGVDQLRKFNQCLLDYATLAKNARGIDGIVLTKFDTIDDKVGAAVSMVYQLGQPIIFVGVGQTYQDLKSIEPDVVVECLMK
jgi:signal recognition particle receptor subunit alpha